MSQLSPHAGQPHGSGGFPVAPLLDRENPGRLVAARPGFLPGALPGRGGSANGPSHPELAPTGTAGLDSLPIQAQHALVNGLPFGGMGGLGGAAPPGMMAPANVGPMGVAPSNGTVVAGEAPVIADVPMPFAPAKPPLVGAMNVEPPPRVATPEPPPVVAPPAVIGGVAPPPMIASPMQAPDAIPSPNHVGHVGSNGLSQEASVPPPGFVVAAPPIATPASPAQAAVSPPVAAPPLQSAAPAPVAEAEAAAKDGDASDSPWMREPAPVALPSFTPTSETKSTPAAAPAKSGGGSRTALWVVVGLVALGALGVGGYLLKNKLSGSATPDDDTPTSQTSKTSVPAASNAAPTPTPSQQVEPSASAPPVVTSPPVVRPTNPNPTPNPNPIPRPTNPPINTAPIATPTGI